MVMVTVLEAVPPWPSEMWYVNVSVSCWLSLSAFTAGFELLSVYVYVPSAWTSMEPY